MIPDTCADIVYVEDDPLASRLVEEVCRSSGTSMRVRTAHSRAAAVEAVAHEEPDLVLVSVEFDGAGGPSVLKDIHEKVDIKSAPVVLFGNAENVADISGAYESGADAYVQKPSNFSGLLDTVEQLVAPARRTKQLYPHGTHAQPVRERA